MYTRIGYTGEKEWESPELREDMTTKAIKNRNINMANNKTKLDLTNPTISLKGSQFWGFVVTIISSTVFVGGYIAKVESRLATIETKLDGHKDRFDSIDKRMDSLQTDVREVRKGIDDIKTLLTKK